MSRVGDDAPPTGYRNPPASTRFRKGQSGNPRGRPPGRHTAIPFDAVLGQMVVIRENGEERRLTAAEAFLLQLTKKGLEGDGASARTALRAIADARASGLTQQTTRVDKIVWTIVRPGSVNTAMQVLRMARKLDPYRDTARMALEPWIVEAALARLGDQRLTLNEQRMVLEATRTPKKVRWPEWWEIKP